MNEHHAKGPVVPVRIEVTKGSHLKRNSHGRVEFVSPLPCPYNYGSILDTVGDDGDALDAVCLGPKLPHGSEVWGQVLGIIAFWDQGVADHKVICRVVDGEASAAPLSRLERGGIQAFFSVYAKAKRLSGPLLRDPAESVGEGETVYEGWLPPHRWPELPSVREKKNP